MKQAESVLEREEGDHIVLKHNKKNTEATNYLSRTNMPATVQGTIVHIVYSRICKMSPVLLIACRFVRNTYTAK